MDALVDLVKAGKVRYIGLSAPSPATLRRAHKVLPIVAIQVQCSPFVMEIEEKGHLFDTARDLGITVVAYLPIGKGLLNNQITSREDLPEGDFRRSLPKYSDVDFPKIMALAAKIQEIENACNTTASQIALAFLLAQGDDIIPIPETKSIKYIKENLDTTYIELTSNEIESIRKAIQDIEVSGDRYPLMFMQML